jgi:hypothetical protein
MGKRIYEWNRNFYLFRWNTEIRHMEKWKATRIMSKENYLNKVKDLPETVKQFGGLVLIVLIIFFSFSVLNIMFGGGDELVRKMKLEEERIAEEKKLSELISKLPSGILVTFDGTDHYKLTDEVYEQVCKATKLIPQRAIMGANFLNFRAHEIYTINGNKIDETFVKWDEEKNKCYAGFTVSGDNVGVNESVSVSGEALSFLSTGIDTRVYYIKNF